MSGLFRKKRSDAGIKRGTLAERQLQHEKHLADYEAHMRGMLASWSEERLYEAVAAVQAGNCDGVEGWEAKDWPTNRFTLYGRERFELRFLREELERRGFLPLRGSA